MLDYNFAGNLCYNSELYFLYNIFVFNTSDSSDYMGRSFFIHTQLKYHDCSYVRPYLQVKVLFN